MGRPATFVDRHLQTRFYYPNQSYTDHHRLNSMLVIGNELASRLMANEDRPGDFGRLVQNVSRHLGIAACGYERLGTGRQLSWKDRRAARSALAPEHYQDTMADIGTVLARRIRERGGLAVRQIILVGKSGGGTAGIGLTHANTIHADCGIFMDPAGMHDMGSPLKAAWGLITYKQKVERKIEKPDKLSGEVTNAEPTSLVRQWRDYKINGEVASSNLPRTQLKSIPIPVVIDVPEFGMYCSVEGFSTHELVSSLNGPAYPNVKAYFRPEASHDWYNGSLQYARAIREGLGLLHK